MLKIRFWLPALALFLSGCSPDPLAPTEANFRKAVEAALTSDPICDTAGINNITAWRMLEGPPTEYYLTLQRLGLIDIKKDTSTFANGNSVTIPDTSHWTEKKGFCIAAKKLEKIVRWTEPAAINGRTISEITYEWSAVPTQWTTNDILKALNFSPPQHKTSEITLIKMSDGWRPRS